MNNDKLFIGISAIIGAGKTTLTNALAESLKYLGLFEPVSKNKYLDDFYKFINNYSKIKENINSFNINSEDKWMYENSIVFNIQIEWLWRRYALHQQAIYSPVGIVQDRLLFEDVIFAKMLSDSGIMKKRDFENYIGLFNILKPNIEYPDLILYLKIDPSIAFERIKKRGRPCESEMSLKYLQDLNKNYEEYIESISKSCNVWTIDWNENINLENGDYDKIVKDLSIKIMNKKENNLFYKNMVKI